MKSKHTPPKAGAVKRLRELWFKRKEDVRKKNQEEAKKRRESDKKIARPFSETDAEI